MVSQVVVYSSQGCQGCKLTQRALRRAGVAVEVVDVATSPAAQQLLVAMEFGALPVVTTGDEWWSGYRPERIRSLVTEAKNAH